MKLERLSVERLALSVGRVAATCLAPKEDFTLNAKPFHLQRGWRTSVM
jgi:hypothetical protein